MHFGPLPDPNQQMKMIGHNGILIDAENRIFSFKFFYGEYYNAAQYGWSEYAHPGVPGFI